MKISIVVPIYNVEKYLERCIQTLINQTYSNIEIVLVNDGSPDDSLSICKKYAEKDKRIKIVDKINGGLSDARNAGVKVAEGEYILFVDSDDYIENTSCQKFAEVISKLGHLDILSGNANVLKDGKISYMNHSGDDTHVISGKEFLKNEIKRDSMYMAAWLNLYRKDFLIENNLRFKKGLLHEDEEFTPRAFLMANRVACMQFNFYNYIIRDDSISTQKDMSKNAEHLFSTLHKLEKIYDELEDDELKKLLKNSLADKYLNMCQLLNNTKSSYNKQLETDFVKRNSFSSRTLKKSKLFGLNKKLYFFVNNFTKNILLDLNEILNKENIFYTGLAVFGVIFLSRFFQLYVDYSDLTSNLYVFLSRLVAVLAFALYTKQLVKKDISIFNIFLSLFYIIVIIINILNGGNLRTILSVTYPIIVLSMIMEICFKHNYKSTIISLNYIFIILIFINFFQMVFFNNLLGEYQYFLGGRNHLGIILLISTFITHLYSSIRKDSCIFKIVLTMSFLTTLIAGSINNSLAYLVLIFYVVLEKKNSCFIDWFDNLSMEMISFSYIGFFFSVVVLRVQNLFSFFIEDLFHRSISLSGRTYIWDKALNKIINNLFLGYGKGLDNNYFTVSYIMSNNVEKKATYSAHNTFLQIAYESGIVPIVLFFSFIIYIGKWIKAKKIEEMDLFYIVVFALLIIMMMEAVGFDGIFFVFSVAFFYCKYKVKGEDL